MTAGVEDRLLNWMPVRITIFWLAWGIALVGGFHLTSSLILAVAGVCESETSFTRKIAAGMTAGFLGDIFMARENLELGLTCFGCGHLIYMNAMWAGRPRFGEFKSMGWIAWPVVAIVSWYAVVFQGSVPSQVILWAALAYSLLLAGTAACATTLAMQDVKFAPLALGSALFLMSDFFLSVRLFSPQWFAKIPESMQAGLVWGLYGPGQMLIVFGAILTERGKGRSAANSLPVTDPSL